MAIRWGLSILDWHSHAIDERGDPSVGVLKAECGHLLMMVTALHKRPNAKPCGDCAGKQLEAARAAVARASAALHLVYGPLALPSPRRDELPSPRRDE